MHLHQSENRVEAKGDRGSKRPFFCQPGGALMCTFALLFKICVNWTVVTVGHFKHSRSYCDIQSVYSWAPKTDNEFPGVALNGL